MNRPQIPCFAACLALALTLTSPRLHAEVADAVASTRDEIYAAEHLLDVRIEVAAKDWDQLRHQTRSLVGSLAQDRDQDSPFEYVPADVTIDGQLIENVGIRKKGFLGSLDNDRPSLKIRFDKYQAQAPFGDLDRLTLNNNKQDPSRLSQYLSYGMFRRAGIACSGCNFAKVSVNGKELGVYSNVESIKRPMLKRSFGDGSGMLYEGTVADLVPGATNRIEAKTKSSKMKPLKQITDFLDGDHFDVEELDGMVDVESFLRFWAVESLIGFWDGYTHNQNNFYLYRNPANAKFYFLPWGTDSAFTDFVPPIIDKIPNRSFHANAALPNRLYHTKESRQKYLQTLRGLLEDEWNEEDLLADIERVQAMLDETVLDKAAFGKAVQRVRGFIQGRRSRIEEELNRWPIPLRHGPRRPGYTKRLGEVTASFDTKWSTPFKFQSGLKGDAEIDLTLDGTPVKLNNPAATATPSKGDEPTITLSATRDSDKSPLSFSLTFRPSAFHPADASVGVGGVFIEGSMLTFLTMMSRNPSAIKLLDGTAELEQASTKVNAPVKGVAHFHIMQFAGGEKPKVAWEENSTDKKQD